MAGKITRDVLESHLTCKFKCHLKLAGLRGSTSYFEDWLVESKASEKRDTIANLLGHYSGCTIVRGTALDVSTLKNASDVILDGTAEDQLLSLRFDALIKVDGVSNLGQFHYVPILFHEGQYLIGIITIVDGQESRNSYWADTDSRQDQIVIFEKLLQHLRRYHDYSILHFGTYELTALRRMKACLTESYQHEIDQAIKRSINVLSVVSPYIYFPTYSNRLKDISGFLGYSWTGPIFSGAQSLVWRARWLESHNISLKTQLIKYNCEDCIALKGVVDFIEKVLLYGRTAPLRGDSSPSITHTDTLAAGKDEWHLFGSTNFALDDFRAINPLSYFDYQRDKVLARANKSHIRKVARRNKRALKANKIVEVGAAKCPFCRGARISPLSRKVHEVIDLKFSKGGIRRWIVRYISRQYHCVGCGRRFSPVRFQRYRRIPKYGEGLVIWCVYQLLIGGQNIHRIHRSLEDLFGLSIPKTSIYKFKRSAACFYEKEYEKLLESLLAGSLVHIDETTINLMKDKGYVWVMTSTDSVYFFYKKSREGSFLAEMLKTFKGVLVSDFYTAYDVVNVPQQRCLIHLMRDMNDDLLKNSFDDELKSVAEKFAFLLRTIVNTIDRHGLKTKYLNKYRKDADRFCDWVVRQNFSSEVAKGYASRIIKYRHMLFTFLSYDGVPWNNNNAEHAIKSFAKYRRFADGVLTENTVKDYLVLLSVCLSCEYRGIEFLGALLGSSRHGRGIEHSHFAPFRLERRSFRRGAGLVNSDQLVLTPKDGCEKFRPVVLNKALPAILHNIARSVGRVRFRTALGADLWPAKLDLAELEAALTMVTQKLRQAMQRRRTIIVTARNVRFDKPESETGLIGRYVLVSMSDGGHVAAPSSSVCLNPVKSGIQEGLNQLHAFAKAAGGAATVRSTYTARNVETTIARMYLAQYSEKPDDSFVVGSKASIAVG